MDGMPLLYMLSKAVWNFQDYREIQEDILAMEQLSEHQTMNMENETFNGEKSDFV